MKKVARYLPGDEKRCSTVLVEKIAPEQVNVGQTFEYHIKVTNLTKAELIDVTVWDTVLENLKISKSTPEATGTKDGWVTWEVGKLDPGEGKLIKVEAVATEVGVLSPCAEVTYRMPQVCMAIDVVQPALTLTKMAPAEQLLCDAIPMKLVVKNTGTGYACNVKVKDTLPEGLKTTDGKDVLVFDAGALGPGQSREFTFEARAAKTGTYVNKATAEADGGLGVESEPVTTMVRVPVLKVDKTGPGKRYVGRPVSYTITVTNTGDATAARTVLTDHLPSNATFVSASDDGKMAGGKVTWNLGTLAPGLSKEVTLTLRATAPGVIRNAAMAKAYCAEASDDATTVVAGIPAILLEVIDLDDPVEVGSGTTYEIIVTNQGSAMGTNIVVICTLPAEETYVKSSGPTAATVKDRVVTFASLASLAPKARATYRVDVKGIKAGDVRFTVSLKSDQMDTTADETEATRIYE